MIHKTLSLCAVACLVISGCSDKKKNDSVQTNETAKVVSATPAVSPEVRKKAFDGFLKSLADTGMEINRTSDNHFVLTVVDPHKTTAELARLFNAGINMQDPQFVDMISEELNGTRLDVTVDWDKYLKNAPDSVTLAYLGTGKEPKAYADLLKQKKIAALLSFDANDKLTALKAKDIDETIDTSKEVDRLTLRGMHIDFTTPLDPKSEARRYTLAGGTVLYETRIKDNNLTMRFRSRDLQCDIDKKNDYLGSQECTLPTLAFEVETPTSSTSDKMTVTFNRTHYKVDSVADKGKVGGDVKLQIKSIDFALNGINPAQNADGTINTVAIDVKTSNVDEATLKAYTAFLHNPPQDHNEAVRKLMDYVGKLYSGGMAVDYSVSVASAKGTAQEGAFNLDGFDEKGSGRFDTSITFKDTTKIAKFEVTDKSDNRPVVSLRDFTFGYDIKDLYNFLPAFFTFSAEQVANPAQPSDPAVVKALSNMANDFIHHGFSFTLAPVGWNKLGLDAQGKKIDLGKTDLKLSLVLDKNTVPMDMNNPMTGMMLLSFLHADGKLVLPQKDLETLSRTLPPQAIAMLMMYAKQEGDKAVFVFKYQNGRLFINGQPLM